MFITLTTAVVFHLKVADGLVVEKSLSFLSFFSHNSKTTSWLDPRTQGKEIVSKTECECIYVHVCASLAPLHFLLPNTLSLSLQSSHKD